MGGFYAPSYKGTKIVYVTGNHDDFLRSYSPSQFGNIEIVDEYVWNDFYISHGDKYDGIVSLKWLGVIGSYGYEVAIIIDRFFKRLGFKKSISKTLKNKVKNAVKFVTDFERQLAYQAHVRGLKGVICGHIHTPNDKVVHIKGESLRYLNCGDWIENNSYIIYHKGEFKLV